VAKKFTTMIKAILKAPAKTEIIKKPKDKFLIGIYPTFFTFELLVYLIITLYSTIIIIYMLQSFKFNINCYWWAKTYYISNSLAKDA
jgi:hypothetical protein